MNEENAPKEQGIEDKVAPPLFLATCIDLRNNMKEIAKAVKTFKKEVAQSDSVENEDRGEELANLTLAYRHIEDASMRIGKAIQAYEGGVSIYDKKKESESSAVGS